MHKRKFSASDAPADQFQSLRQISTLNHVQCREVLKVLNGDQAGKGRRAATRQHQLYPAAFRAVRTVPLHMGSSEITLHMVSVAAATQNKVETCAFFAEQLLHTLEKIAAT